MKFNLFELFRNESAAGNAVLPLSAKEATGKQWPPPLMPQEEWDKHWPELLKREAQSQIAFRLGVILYEKHTNISDAEQNGYAYDIADFFSKYEDARGIMTRIEGGEHPSQILEELKKNIKTANNIGAIAPVP